MKFGPFDVSDEVLFRSPAALVSWAECVAHWNDLVDYGQERSTWLQQAVLSGIRRDLDTAFVKSYFDEHLDALVARLLRAQELAHMVYARAVEIELGWEARQVLEAEVAGRDETPPETRLIELKGGGLQRRGESDDSFRLHFRMVEPWGKQWLSCSSGLGFHSLPLAEARLLKVRSDIRALRPSEAPHTWLPAELGAEEALRKVAQAHNPRGLEMDRRSVLLNFWLEGLELQRVDPPGQFLSGDIVRLHPKNGASFHVVAHSLNTAGDFLLCYDPRKLLPTENRERLAGELHTISVKSSRLDVVLPAKLFARLDLHIPNMASYALAVREDLRKPTRSNKRP